MTVSRFLALAMLVPGVSLAACTTASAPANEPVPVQLPFVAGFQPDSFLVRFTTTKGAFEVVIRRAWAPNGAQQAYEAFATGYYDGARFFRTIRGFVSQFGIAADSARTAAWRSRTIPDDPVTQSNRRGTLVFAADAAPNTRTVQLFFNLRDNARLDALGFPPIGEIVRGIDVLDSLYTGYGDGATAPSQDRLAREGETYLAANFPLLDQITRAAVIRTWPGNMPTATTR